MSRIDGSCDVSTEVDGYVRRVYRRPEGFIDLRRRFFASKEMVVQSLTSQESGNHSICIAELDKELSGELLTPRGKDRRLTRHPLNRVKW